MADDDFGTFVAPRLSIPDIGVATAALEAAHKAHERGDPSASPRAVVHMVSVDGLLNAAANDDVITARCVPSYTALELAVFRSLCLTFALAPQHLSGVRRGRKLS